MISGNVQVHRIVEPLDDAEIDVCRAFRAQEEVAVESVQHREIGELAIDTCTTAKLCRTCDRPFAGNPWRRRRRVDNLPMIDTSTWSEGETVHPRRQLDIRGGRSAGR